jgi:hypothetical protein
LAAPIFAVAARPQGTNSTAAASAPKVQQSQPPTVASAVDREITAIEKQIEIVGSGDMLELNGKRAHTLVVAAWDVQVLRREVELVFRHGFGNIHIWSPLTGDKLPEGLKDGNGPENLKTKAEIIKFLKDSFALGHKAAATLTTENMLLAPEHSKSTRLRLATFGVAHAYDHYGQMVEYLRMNGIVPPASRVKSD